MLKQYLSRLSSFAIYGFLTLLAGVYAQAALSNADFYKGLNGIWVVETSNGAPATRVVVLRFDSAGNYLMGVNSVNGAGANPGIEAGTLRRDEATGEIGAASVSLDTNGHAGLSDSLGVPHTGVYFALLTGGRLVVRDVSSNSIDVLKRLDNDPKSTIGAWSPSATDLMSQLYVVLPDGHFMTLDPTGQVFSGNCGMPGIEYGTYSYDAQTRRLIALTKEVDTNGCGGAAGANFNTVLSADGATISSTDGVANFLFYRVSTPPTISPLTNAAFFKSLQGVWAEEADNGIPVTGANIGRFDGVGNYVLGSADVSPGVEAGSVGRYESTGEMSVIVTLDTNGNNGLGRGVGSIPHTGIYPNLGSDGRLYMIANGDVDVLRRIDNAASSFVGAWSIDNTTVRTQQLVLSSDGHFMFIDPVGDNGAGACGGPGVEYGTYVYDGASRRLRVTGATVDTNGCAGFITQGAVTGSELLLAADALTFTTQGAERHIGYRTSTPPVTDATTSSVANADHHCAVLGNGSVQCWGSNDSGQLGNSSRTDSLAPVVVKGLNSVRSVVTTGSRSCALLIDGSVRCWGLNDQGQLGDGSLQDQLLPVAVTGLAGATDLAINHKHGCALLANGAVQCWGANADGSLGNGTSNDSAVPVAVSNLAGVKAIGVGRNHSCAIAAGAISCWGSNANGQLGNGGTTSSKAPVAVAGISNAVAVVGGQAHSCALLASGVVQCWGQNNRGQLGNGTTVDSVVPVNVAGISQATAIASRANHSCALITDGSVRCWGANDNAQLGNSSIFDSAIPVTVARLANAASVFVGKAQSCATLKTGAVLCWGANATGQLGNGTLSDAALPQSVVNTTASGILSLRADGSSNAADVTTPYFVLADKQDSALSAKVTDERIAGGIDATVYFTGLLPANSPLLTASAVNGFADASSGMVTVSFGRGGVKQTGPGIQTPPAATGTVATGNQFSVYSGVGKDPLLGTNAVICMGFTIPALSAKGQVLMRPIASGDKVQGIVQCPAVQTNATSAYTKLIGGSTTSRTIKASIEPDADDRGQVRNVYSWAVAPNGAQFMQTGPNQWELMREPMQPAMTVTVPTSGPVVLPVVEGLDLSSLVGTLVYVGFGSSWDEVRLLNKAALYYTVD